VIKNRTPFFTSNEWQRQRIGATRRYTVPTAAQRGALLTGAGVLNLDLSLLKNFRVVERYNVQFRAEATNAANHTQFLIPGTVLGSSSFGVTSGARSARVLQLGLKLEF